MPIELQVNLLVTTAISFCEVELKGTQRNVLERENYFKMSLRVCSGFCELTKGF